MFSAFSSNLWASALAQGYKLDYWLGTTGGPSISDVGSDAAYLAFQKIDIATLICMHIVDTTRRDWREVLAKDADHLKWAEGLQDKLQNIAIIYVLAGNGTAPWHRGEPEGFTDYHGQQAYSVFWWLDLTSGAVTVPKGQPSQLFGIRGLIEKARAEAVKTVGEHGGQGLAESRGSFSEQMPPGKKWVATYAQPVRRVPLMTYLFVGINGIVLLLMYMAGYPADMWVPARFGAIVPALILEQGEWYRLFTAMFIHFGLAHFLTNVMGLVIFGTRVERYFGRLAFCLSYIFTGLMGSVFSLYFTRGYAAGASGAVYGLIGVIFAYTRITGRSIELMNWYIMFLFAGMGIAMGFMTDGVDNFGHLGGLVGGFIIGAGMVGVLRLRGKG
ncbi:MAG: rhomboid family intramembrane serine protease [Defluviitaleaceae bacterium]|nr:rhomboid family intramembrane serine protease [Defluviitaleaceae bacterium]